MVLNSAREFPTRITSFTYIYK